MSWNPALPADTSKIRLSAGYIRSNELAIQTTLSSSSLSGGLPYIPYTSSDTPAPIYFYLAAAPAGWTIVGAISDCLLGIQGGSSQYSAAGGTVVGTWNGPAISLTLAQIVKQNGLVSFGSGGSGLGAWPSANFATPTATHQHDWTNTRPMAAVGILCTKNS